FRSTPAASPYPGGDIPSGVVLLEPAGNGRVGSGGGYVGAGRRGAWSPPAGVAAAKPVPPEFRLHLGVRVPLQAESSHRRGGRWAGGTRARADRAPTADRRREPVKGG